MGSRVTVERHFMSDQPFQDQEYWLGHRAPANDGYSMALGRALEAFGPDLLDAPEWDRRILGEEGEKDHQLSNFLVALEIAAEVT